ncbi:MAG: sugar ABC transporter permease [Treponema sp.]|jgi:ABC-type sugar transport system permease subunit|nr:sugar ABC transporter permease [Treponema sp.]
MKNRDSLTAYMMTAPALLFLLVFVIAPLFMALRYSFFNVSFYQDSSFVGLRNFSIILRTTLFRQSLINAVKFVVIIVPGMMFLAFLLSNALKTLPPAWANFSKTVLYIPGIVSGIAVALIFNFIFNFNAGIINQTLRALGFNRIAFFNSPVLAVLSVSAVSVWIGLGGNTILMYAALVNIPQEYYDAASIDGAGALNKMLFITIPQMKNIFILICISLTTGTLQMFELPYMMTGGGPASQTLTPMLYLYNNYRDVDKGLGYTIAGALIMLVIIASINAVIFRIIRSEKSLEA